MSLTDDRCPQCGALLRAGTPWCTLCHADLRPAVAATEPEPEPEPIEIALVPAVSVTAPTAPVVRTGGKHARPASVAPAGVAASLPLSAADLLGDGDTGDIEVAFAVLRAEGRDPYLAKLEGPLSSPGARLGLIIGGAMALTVGLFVVATLVGATFG